MGSGLWLGLGEGDSSAAKALARRTGLGLNPGCIFCLGVRDFFLVITLLLCACGFVVNTPATQANHRADLPLGTSSARVTGTDRFSWTRVILFGQTERQLP
jgi:hypothetical protein